MGSFAEIDRELARQLKLLEFGTTEVTPREEFTAMLQKSLETGLPLRVKCGIDPTSCDVHLGHTVPYRKMRQFQELGHLGVVVIGDYTASIGDPTGRDQSRQALSLDQVKKNAETYLDQLSTILDPAKTEVRYQWEWFGEANLTDVLLWASQTTAAKLLAHETFKNRLEKGQTLSLHELLYPVLQGMDSVFIKADVELGGQDQRFNVLMGRDYQRAQNMRPQVAILLPLITGTCGRFKMSKTSGNTIPIKSDPFDKFGKVMSIPDSCVLEYYRHLVGLPPEKFAHIEEEWEGGGLPPHESKRQLAQMIVSLFHGEDVGEEMRAKFDAVFKRGQVPDDIPSYTFERGDSLISLLAKAGVLASKGEGRRMVKQKAVTLIDNDNDDDDDDDNHKESRRLDDADMKIGDDFKGKVLKVGKRRFLKLL